MKTVLDIGDDLDFSLIGISCHAKDYRLSWQINKSLGLNFGKLPDASDNEEESIPMSIYYDEDNHTDYALIPNKHDDRIWLPELAQLDYIMKIDGPQHEETALECRSKLQSLDMVLATVVLKASELKSKSVLIF